MIDFLTSWALFVAIMFLGIQLGTIARILREKHVPIGRNEEPTDLEGTNEPEPKKGR